MYRTSIMARTLLQTTEDERPAYPATVSAWHLVLALAGALLALALTV